ncbi:MAG: hypothetical protein GX227_04150 [Clostridiaceae bacterium]|jgi:hypothetical protein|nr:hypothetical protein [Clostridiaceae bacterium]
MEGNLSKALWLGVSILLFIAVVTIGLSIFGGMKEVSSLANDKVGSIAQSLAEEEFRMYDGKEVRGDDVLSALGSFSGRSGDVIVMVATLGNNSGNPINLDPSANTGLGANYTKYISNTTGTLSVDNRCIILSAGSGSLLTGHSKTVIDAARRDAENPNLTSKYINPSGKFISYLIYDENLKIRGVIFAQTE